MGINKEKTKEKFPDFYCSKEQANMRLEYRILEIAQGNEQECNFCFLDFDDPTLLNFDTALATHQMAHNTPDGYSDIVFICSECKKDQCGT
ncbi:21649_t:CDS:2 [Entrophospora sp. SA101]|nr:21649_t:CDS:2 [Entrophospora sp. SA101]